MYVDVRLRLSTWGPAGPKPQTPSLSLDALSCIAGSAVEQLRSWALFSQPQWV